MKLILNSLRFYGRSHLGVLLGTVLAAAVLTGSLLVGDSVKGSLQKFALQRLGKIQFALRTPNRFFASDLARRISDESAAGLQLRGMAITNETQVNRVQVLGCSSNFWRFAGIQFELAQNEVALNQKLAAALNVAVGDEVSLRIEKPGLLPSDAPLATQKEDRTVRGRFTVARILTNSELGRFSLAANQVVPYNAFLNLQSLAERTELTGKANLLLTASSDPTSQLQKIWKPEDFGLTFRTVDSVVQLESDRVYLDPEAERAALSIPGAEGTLTYLVNALAKGKKSTPLFVCACPW